MLELEGEICDIALLENGKLNYVTREMRLDCQTVLSTCLRCVIMNLK